MGSSFMILRVSDDVRSLADIVDGNWSHFGDSRALRDRLIATFPMAEVDFRAGGRGWCAALSQEYDFVLEVETILASEDVSGVVVRVLPDRSPGRKQGNHEIVRERVRLVAGALDGAAFDDDARF
jgi:hypothetical protein